MDVGVVDDQKSVGHFRNSILLTGIARDIVTIGSRFLGGQYRVREGLAAEPR
jgi:hypothetical protein